MSRDQILEAIKSLGKNHKYYQFAHKMLVEYQSTKPQTFDLIMKDLESRKFADKFALKTYLES